MRPIPAACRESMERVRMWRSDVHGHHGRGLHPGALMVARTETRAILAALRAARRSEGALLTRWGVPGG